MSGLAHPTERFRPDLEGLRAVAVVLVLLYHANIPGFEGGYIGVDVFFVLSGFLITGVIYRELRTTGGFNLADFYARRARRLLPAAGVALLVTLLASMVILPFFRLPTVAGDVASAGLYISNIRFGLQASDYFQATSDPSPVLHFWSLSVEEQFYIFWPAMLLAAHHWLRVVDSKRNRVTLAIVAIGLASLVAGVWLTGVNQPQAFFLLPTRAWELAIGGLIAVRARELAAIPRWIVAVATPAGVALVLAASVLYNDATPFPGIAALLPVAGSVLVIAGGLHAPATLPGRILSLAPFRYLGRISYSLYLWHWPIIVLGTSVLGASAAPLLALASIGVAAVSQRVVEEPMRYGRLIGVRTRWNLVQAAGVGAIILAVSYAVSPFPLIPGGAAPPDPPRTPTPVAVTESPVASSSSSPLAPTPSSGRSPDTSPTQSPGEDAPPTPCSGCTIGDLVPPLDALSEGFSGVCDLQDIPDPTKCVLGSVDSRRVIAVFGDSFAHQLVPAFDVIGKNHDLRVVNLSRGYCPAAAVISWSLILNRVETECDQWREKVFERLEAEEPTVIAVVDSQLQVLIDANGAQVAPRDFPDEPYWSLWAAGLQSTLARLSPLGDRVVVMGAPPRPYFVSLEPASCIATHPTDFAQLCQGRRVTMVETQAHAVLHTAAAANGATFVDPTAWFCDAVNCPSVIGRFVVYRDTLGHLTAPFVVSLADKLTKALGLVE